MRIGDLKGEKIGICVSGGLDSTHALIVAAKACDRLGLPRTTIRGSGQATIEAPEDRDEGWTTELAVPWSEVCEHTGVECPVGPGTTLRVNTFRLERPRKGSAVGLALSPTRVPDFHAPENSAVLELLP